MCMISAINGQYEHLAVLKNEEQEALLPNEYRNPFLSSPHVRMALHWSSWLHPGELPVQNREADRIPRYAIFKVLTHAGLLQPSPRHFFFR